MQLYNIFQDICQSNKIKSDRRKLQKLRNSFYHLSSASSGELSSSWAPEVKRFGHEEEPSSSSSETVRPIQQPISVPECEIYGNFGNFGHFDSGIENTDSVSEQKISNVTNATNINHVTNDESSHMSHLNTREFTLPRRNISYFFALSGSEIKFQIFCLYQLLNVHLF